MPYRAVAPWSLLARSAWWLLGLGIAGVAGGVIAIGVSGLGAKSLIAAAGVGMIGAIMVLTGRPKEVLLAAYIVALSYNRQYFSFDGWLGNSGAQGLYWLPADPVLLLLLLSPLVSPQRSQAGPSASVMTTILPVLPFLAACCLSTLMADRADWAANDTYRVLKFTILLAWLHLNMTRSLWLTAVAALAFVVGIQSVMGILQVALKSQASLLASLGLAQQVESIANDIENRSRGTLGHPNLFAPYILMLLPAFYGAALFTRDRLLALAGLGLTAIGFVALVTSKSRAPVALGAVGLLLVTVLAIRLRALSVRRALGSAVLAVAVLAAAAVPLMQDIIDRVQGDFGSSVEFRAEYNRAGFAIWDEHPILGIGPNNVNVDLGRHVPWLEQLIKDAEKFRDLGNVRTPTVHNIYVLMLAETGIVGTAAFLFLLLTPLVRAFRLVPVTDGAVRGGCVGIGCALIVSYAQQMVDFSLWYDASWFTLAIVIALIATVPLAQPDASRSRV